MEVFQAFIAPEGIYTLCRDCKNELLQTVDEIKWVDSLLFEAYRCEICNKSLEKVAVNG